MSLTRVNRWCDGGSRTDGRANALAGSTNSRPVAWGRPQLPNARGAPRRLGSGRMPHGCRPVRLLGTGLQKSDAAHFEAKRAGLLVGQQESELPDRARVDRAC